MPAHQSGYVNDNDFVKLNNWLQGNHYSQVFILCDNNTFRFCLPVLLARIKKLGQARVITVPSGEGHKTLSTAESIWSKLFRQNADRKTLLVNLGGGMITDLGAFCAATYKRGIATIHVPTSVMAMADAAIGGKCGVDTAYLKNAIGTFYQPKGIFVSTRFLKTLPEREYLSGFAEICKTAIVADSALWKMISVRNSKKNDPTLIEKAAKAKLKICSRDPFDQHLRKSLNFGHTIGHGIESWYLKRHKTLPHGEAVAAGMIIEAHTALRKNLLSTRSFMEIEHVLAANLRMPAIKDIKLEAISQFLANDKKNTGGSLMPALPVSIGRCAIDVPCTLREAGEGLAYYQSLKR